MSTPIWVLTVSFWLHMVATVTWVGGLASLSLVILPTARRSLDKEGYAVLLRNINKRLDPLGWLGLAVLTTTGLIQMGANSNYEGLFGFSNSWAQALLLKHILFLGIVGISGYQTWRISPQLERLAFQKLDDRTIAQKIKLERQEKNLLRGNLALGLLVLFFTSLARVA